MDEQTGLPEKTETLESQPSPPLPVKVNAGIANIRPHKFTKENAAAMARKGHETPRRRKTVPEIFDVIDRELLKNPEIARWVPKDAQKHDLTHYLTIRKLAHIAYRDNTVTTDQDVVCPSCKEKFKAQVLINDPASEDRSIKALNSIYDRLAPKLGAIHVDVRAETEINSATEIMADIIMRYVPDDQRKECMQEIQIGLSQARKYGQTA